MYDIILYKDKNGNSIIEEYINNLQQKSNKSKENRIKYNKMISYLRMLKQHRIIFRGTIYKIY